MYRRTRLSPEERRQQIITAALKVAGDRGLYSFNIKAVSLALQDCSKSTIKHYFSIDDLRTAVVEAAIDLGQSDIVTQAITMKHPAVANLTDEQRQGYLADV